MGDMLRQGSDWLEQQRTAHCTSPVEYRSPSKTLTVNATYGKTDYQVVDEGGGGGGGGMTIGSQVVDFLMLADELGQEPKVGDVIAADGRRHEVLALGEDLKGWRWSDPYHTTYRIHTRDIGPSHG